jgi:hypothetical protein
MPEAVREANKEYWRPANVVAARLIQPLTTHILCPECETEYTPGANFCHVCGKERDQQAPSQTKLTFAQLLDMEVIRKLLGLSWGSLVFFIIGLTFMLGALLTGFVYRASTLLDWQAVQMWRIEWLLAAAAAMLAGILLKKRKA